MEGFFIMSVEDKKIFSVGMVKNNVEVIESHIRYNLNILDGMLILDNGSTDGTLELLKLLEDEGLPLYVLEDKDREYEQALKINQLIKKAVNEFDADIIVPLDSDEFLTSENKGNPRKFLERIEPNTFHLVKWKTYVPDLSKKKNEKFIPARITLARDDTLEEYYKVIIPKELVMDYNVQTTFGNHTIRYEPQYDDIINGVENPNLRIAHFPLVSKKQTISKVAIGWIYNCYRPKKRKNENFHLKIMFDKLKKKEDLDDADVMNFAQGYALKNDQLEIKLKEDPMDLSFCDDIEIKYTLDKQKSLSNLLESFEWLAFDAANFKKNSIAEKKRFESEIQELSMKLDDLNSQNQALETGLIEQIQRYEDSKSWKITAPFRKFSNKMRKSKQK